MSKHLFSYTINNKIINVHYYRKTNMTNLKFKILDQDNLMISSSLPYNRYQKQINDLIKSNEDYIINELKKFDDIKYYLWGKEISINLINDKKFSYELNNNILLIKSNKDLNTSYKMVLTKEIEKYIDNNKDRYITILSIINLNYINPIYRFLKTAWGVYKPRLNTITINPKLACFNPMFTDYVIYHEHIHIIHPNHSKTFHDALEYLVPNHLVIRKLLNKQKMPLI